MKKGQGGMEIIIYGIIMLAVCAITGVLILYVLDNVGGYLTAQAAVTAPDAVANMNTTINSGHSAILGFFTWFNFFVILLAATVLFIILTNIQSNIQSGRGRSGRR